MINTTDWYPDWHSAHGRHNREVLLERLGDLQWSGVITLWADVDEHQQHFYHIEWVDGSQPEFAEFCRWMAKQPAGVWGV